MAAIVVEPNPRWGRSYTSSMVQFPEDVVAAGERLAGVLPETETVLSHWLSSRTGGRIHLKLENLQQTGSFKVRGALNRMLVLGDRGRSQRGRGRLVRQPRHGGGSRLALARLPTRGSSCPRPRRTHKVEAIELLGAKVERAGRDCLLTEQTCPEVRRPSPAPPTSRRTTIRWWSPARARSAWNCTDSWNGSTRCWSPWEAEG